MTDYARDPQEMPTRNERTAIQDLVIADLRERKGNQLRDLLVTDIETRKEIGLKKYGTLLQAFNGRDALVDAYQESLDLVQYLRQCVEEGMVSGPYERAINMALDLRYFIWEREREEARRAANRVIDL